MGAAGAGARGGGSCPLGWAAKNAGSTDVNAGRGGSVRRGGGRDDARTMTSGRALDAPRLRSSGGGTRRRLGPRGRRLPAPTQLLPPGRTQRAAPAHCPRGARAGALSRHGACLGGCARRHALARHPNTSHARGQYRGCAGGRGYAPRAAPRGWTAAQARRPRTDARQRSAPSWAVQRGGGWLLRLPACRPAGRQTITHRRLGQPVAGPLPGRSDSNVTSRHVTSPSHGSAPTPHPPPSIARLASTIEPQHRASIPHSETANAHPTLHELPNHLPPSSPPCASPCPGRS